MGKRAIAIAAVALLVGVAAGYAFGSSGDSDGSSGAGTDTRSPSPSPVHLVKVGGVFMNERHDELTADMEPYPYTSPIPPREPTAIDGTYVRIMSLHDVGGPVVGLPYRCLRCIPYRVDPGTTTLIFYEGRYFLHHSCPASRRSATTPWTGTGSTCSTTRTAPRWPGTTGGSWTAGTSRSRP